MKKSMLTKIAHIGIAGKDLKAVENTVKLAFDLPPQLTEDIDDQMVRVLAQHIGGSTIEYLEPTADSSPIARYIKKHGPGLHHIAYRVENLAASLEQLKQRGFRLIDSQPRDGAEDKKIAFVHPASSNGILIELCETDK